MDLTLPDGLCPDQSATPIDSVCDLRAFLAAFADRGDGGPPVVELRALKVPRPYGRPGTQAGFFDLREPSDVTALLQIVADYNGRTPDQQPRGVYLTLNPVNAALRARAAGRVTWESASAGDGDVESRRFLPVDVDPTRPSGISATDAEKAAAGQVLDAVVSDLRDRGWGRPIVIDTGNGYQAWFPIDLPADDGGLVERCLKALAARHDTEAAHVDKSLFNPSRIVKLPGTWARKGDEIPGRPHRMSRIVSLPARREGTPRELVEALAEECAAEKKLRQKGDGSGDGCGLKLKVGEYLTARGIDYREKDRDTKRGAGYVLRCCPFDPSHQDPDAIVMQDVTGALSFKCLHNSCAGRGWQEFKAKVGKPDREHYDPPLADAPKVYANGRPFGESDPGASAALPGGAKPPEKPRFTFIDSAEFLTADYRQRFLIPGVLVADQPAVIAGPSKAMKTSLTVDMAVSLAAGAPFLGKFKVPKPVRVALVSGESGKATLQETTLRVLAAKGIGPDTVAGKLKWEFRLPRFQNVGEMKEFAAVLLSLNVELVVIDPLYLCLGGEIDHANMFAMGAAFQVVADELLRNGVTPVLVHHANRQLRTGDPMEITHLAYSGLEQFARQFLMLNRQTPYRGDGVHDLWLSAGGSAGHGGLWSVHVEEGTVDEFFRGRTWNVTVSTQGEAFAAAGERKAAKKDDVERKKLQKEENDLLTALDHAAADGRPATKTYIRERFPRLKGVTLDDALARLIRTGEIESFECAAGGGNGSRQRTTAYRRVAPRER